MQKYQDIVQSTSGTKITGASILVKTYPGGNVATIYSDNGINTQPNPVTSDSNGRYSFYAADGRYQLTVSKSGFTTQTITDILLEDPLDGSAAVFSTVTATTLTATTINVTILNAANLLASTGAALIGFIQLGTGAILRTIQSLFRERVSVKDFGAVGDGVTDDSAAIQLALNYISTLGGGTLRFPSGTYLCPSTSTLLRIKSSIVLRGDGMFNSVIQFSDTSSVSRMLGTDAASAYNIVFEDMGFASTWTNGSVYTQSSQMVLLDTTANVSVNRCRFSKSRNQSLIISGANKASVTNCEFYLGRSDGCRIIATKNSIVGNNYFEAINDDCIAIHTEDSQSSPVISSATITGNRIVDCQGIACLGAKHTTITGNSLTRVACRAIWVGVDTATTTEGNTANFSVNISDNVIDTVFTGTIFRTSGGGAGANYIMVTSAIPTVVAGSGYVGQANGSGGVVQPFNYLYTNNTDANAPVAGNWFINITNNTCVRSLPTIGAYSSYGFGTRVSKDGPLDPAITLTDMGAAYAQIQVDHHGEYLRIQNNNLWGGGYGVWLNGTVASAYISFKNVVISDNTICNFQTYGIWLDGEGYATVRGNYIDGDPLNVHPNRLANGKWDAGVVFYAVYLPSSMHAIVNDNEFGNVAQVTASTTTNAEWYGNKMYCYPVTFNAYDANNIGIGNPQRPDVLGCLCVIRDDDPASATFGKILNICVNSSNGLPATGYYVQNHVTKNAGAGVAGGGGSQYVVTGWFRLTTGSAHVLNTDWVEMRTLTGT